MVNLECPTFGRDVVLNDHPTGAGRKGHELGKIMQVETRVEY